jgi:hypothetical protein
MTTVHGLGIVPSPRCGTDTENAMKIKCVVACVDASGCPALYSCVVEVEQDEYDEGDHYEAARDTAGDDGYETNKSVVFDENDGPDWLFEKFWPGETPTTSKQGNNI